MFLHKIPRFPVWPQTFFYLTWCRGAMQHVVLAIAKTKKESRLWALWPVRELRGQTEASHSSRHFTRRRRSGVDATRERRAAGTVGRTGRSVGRVLAVSSVQVGAAVRLVQFQLVSACFSLSPLT